MDRQEHHKEVCLEKNYKDKNTVATTGAGLSVTSLLGLIFIVLKLIGVIDWSWWWVTAPFWIPIVIVLLVIVIIIIVYSIKEHRENKRLHRQ